MNGKPNRWGLTFDPEHRAVLNPFWRWGYTLQYESILGGTEQRTDFSAAYFRLHEPPIQRLDKWDPEPPDKDAEWGLNNASRWMRCSIAYSHYMVLCDRFDLRNGVEPIGPYGELKRLPSGWQMHASGGRLLFDARQATTEAHKWISYNTQRFLLPLLGHPLVETAFRADPFQWSRVARFLVIAAVREAKSIFDPLDFGVSDEEYDAFYRKCWPYSMEPFLYDGNPVAPDDPSEFFRFMAAAMDAESGTEPVPARAGDQPW